MQRNQIFLEDRTNEENKKFLKELYGNNKLVSATEWFDILDDDSGGRQSDKNMTLDSFLERMKGKYIIRLDVGSPLPEKISYCANLFYDRPERFVWVECPLTKHNYDVVAELFKKVYGQDIESVKVPDYVKEYDKSLGPLPF